MASCGRSSVFLPVRESNSVGLLLSAVLCRACFLLAGNRKREGGRGGLDLRGASEGKARARQ